MTFCYTVIRVCLLFSKVNCMAILTIGKLARSAGVSVETVRFYERRGFRLVSSDEKDRLLRRYWSVPDRQIETSVVLADQRWFGTRR